MHWKNNILFRRWIGHSLPVVHVRFDRGLKKALKDLFIHPLKRRLAKYYLLLLQKFSHIKVIAITGSAGKTTVKEMLFSILSQEDITVSSYQNIDPVFNIPETILKCNLKTKYLILEFGVEYPGEMDFYLWLVKPDIAIITNIFPTHTEFFGDSDGVFREKSKLAKNIQKNGFVVLNADDSRLTKLDKLLKAKIFWFRSTPNPLTTNSNAAIVCAKSLGISSNLIEQGIKKYSLPIHRFNKILHSSGATVIDDSYNSNPEAAKTAIKYFVSLAKNEGAKRMVLVLGDMLELGDYTKRGHLEVGKTIVDLSVDEVLCIGKLSKTIIAAIEKHNPKIKVQWFESYDKSRLTFAQLLKSGNYILVKGSRGMHLDKLIDMLR